MTSGALTRRAVACRLTMEMPPGDKIGRNWIIAIVALLALLVLGIVLYLMMSAPIRAPAKRSAILSHRSVTFCAASGYKINGAR